MNFILKFVKKIKSALKRVMNVQGDPFILEEVVIRRLESGLFKSNKRCCNCDQIKTSIRICKKCRSYICSSCFINFITEEIPFKSLCRINHERTTITGDVNDDGSNISVINA